MCYIFVTSSLVTVAIQMFMPNVLISLCVNSLCFLGVLLVIDNEDEILDPVTKCFNRRFFVQKNMERMGQEISYNILSVRILDYNLHTATLGINLMNQFISQVGSYLDEMDEEVFYYEKGAFAILFADDDISNELMQNIQNRFSENWKVNDVVLQLNIDMQLLKTGEQITSVEELLLSLESQNDEATSIEVNKSVSVEDYRRRLSVVKAIKRAIVTDGFIVSYQPVWNARNNMITKAKVIVYMLDDELGKVEAEEFIQVAEKNELSNEIGDKILRKVIKTFKENNFAAIGIEMVEIELSPLQSMNIYLKERVLDILREFEVSPEHIEFQFSVGALLKQQDIVIENMDELHKAGFKIQLIGYGSEAMKMVNMLQYPVDGIQIDKQVLKSTMDQELVLIFIKNSIRMFHEMNLEIEIDGVDDVYGKEMTVELKGDYLSGQFFSGPVDNEGFYRYGRGFNLR